MSKNSIFEQIPMIYSTLSALLYLPPVAGEDLLIEDCSIGAEEGHWIQGLRTAHITISCKTHGYYE
jgi:hypothetical protein